MKLGNKKSVIGWEYIIFARVQEKHKIKRSYIHVNLDKRQIGKVVLIHASHYVEVTNQPNAPAALPWERSLTYSDYRYR
jgi:hypothetical protein